jgi:hypothetical protein
MSTRYVFDRVLPARIRRDQLRFWTKVKMS